MQISLHLNRDLSEFHDGSQNHKTRPVDGSQKVCYVGMAPSSSKVYADNRSAPVNFALAWLTKGLLRWNSKFYPRVAHKTKACYVVMATSSSKFQPRKANKRSATLEWLLPLQNFALRWLTKKVRYVWR